MPADALALVDLDRMLYPSAGFKERPFMPEPEAQHWPPRCVKSLASGLIVDIGGWYL